MKQNCAIKCGSVLCGLILSAVSASSQGTAFTYQGRLANGTNPVTGLYDFTNALYNAASGGAQAGSTVTLTAVPVTNGLFTVLLDFDGVFNGTPYWLQIGVRSNGVGSYAALTPRQPLTPTPYAITAENLDGTLLGSQLTGTLPAGLLSGTYGNAVNLNNAANSLSGNGAGLTGVNALTLGGLGPNNFWKTGGNSGTTAGSNFIGTTDDQALEVHVNGARGFRVESDPVYSSPNVIGGSAANSVAAGWVGNFIGAGGQTGFASNSITGGNLNVIGGGWNNHSTNGYENVIAGGQYNIAAGGSSSIGGGNQNKALGIGATIPGGDNNTAGGAYSFAAGQNAQALHDGAFVWADDSTVTPFASTGNNQFLIRSSFMGLNRATQVSGNEYFGILAPISNNWGGMYIQTLAAGRPFYGYNNPSGTAWTEMDGTDGNKWKLYNSGYWLTVTPAGSVGIGTTTPAAAALEVANGDVRIDNHELFLTSGSDTNSGFGLGYRTGLPGISSDGPFLYGFNGGALGGLGPTTIALSWDWHGNVWVSNDLSTASLTVHSGPIHVTGAGTNTSTAAFIQVANASNTSSHITTIHNPLCDGDPNAILIVTHNWNPPGVAANYETHPYSVYYTGSNWAIYNDDLAPILGMSFNVLIIKN